MAFIDERPQYIDEQRASIIEGLFFKAEREFLLHDGPRMPLRERAERILLRAGRTRTLEPRLYRLFWWIARSAR